MIETTRLLLKPLTHAQLILYKENNPALEYELKLSTSHRVISPELKEALEETILPNVADPSRNYLYNTLWTGISKTENKMIGDLCIVGEPNEAGEIEIGYGTYEAEQGKGYMTEMVGGILTWAKTQPGMKSIVASTITDNPASGKVLQRNGFTLVKETPTTLYWKLEIKF